MSGGVIGGFDGGAVGGLDGGAVAGSAPVSLGDSLSGGVIGGFDGGAVGGFDGGAVSGLDGGEEFAVTASSLSTGLAGLTSSIILPVEDCEAAVKSVRDSVFKSSSVFEIMD